MKIYILHEISNPNGIISWYHVFPYKNKKSALEHIANEMGEPLDDALINYFKENSEINYSIYTYKITEEELQ